MAHHVFKNSKFMVVVLESNQHQGFNAESFQTERAPPTNHKRLEHSQMRLKSKEGGSQSVVEWSFGTLMWPVFTLTQRFVG